MMRASAVIRPLMLLGIMATYAVCFTAIKAGLPFAPPLWFAGLRALIGGMALLLLMVALRQWSLPPRQSWPGIIVLGLSATTVGYSAMFLSPGRTGAGIASVLGNTQPLIVPALAAILLGERMTPGKWTALALGMFGVTLIASPALAGPGARGVLGPALALAASGGQAVGSVVVKRMGAQIDLLALTAWQLVVGALPILAVSALVEQHRPTVWNSAFIGLLLFLALVGTALANLAWYWLVRHDDVGRLAMFLLLVPVFGLVIAALVFRETVTPLETAGVVVTLLGLGVMALESRGSDRFRSVRMRGR